jgi:hypothetical protein
MPIVEIVFPFDEYLLHCSIQNSSGGGVTAEAREEVDVDVEGPVDNRWQHNERGADTEQEPE